MEKRERKMAKGRGGGVREEEWESERVVGIKKGRVGEGEGEVRGEGGSG